MPLATSPLFVPEKFKFSSRLLVSFMFVRCHEKNKKEKHLKDIHCVNWTFLVLVNSMSKLLRICSTIPVQSQPQKRPDGSYFYDGVASRVGNEMLDLLGRTVKNFSLFATISTDECVKRLKNNETDMSTSAFMFSEDSPYYQVPVPMFDSKIVFMAGYDLKGKTFQPKEYGTVFTNISLLEAPVYLWALFLVVSLIAVIWASTLVHSRQRSKLRRNRLSNSTKKNRSIKNRLIMRCLRRTRLVLDGKSEKLRLITFLCVILSFYLTTCFMILYKTSRIIVEQPYVVTNYEQLINDRTAIPGFYDFKISVSHKFRDAPNGTRRAKVWSKLIEARENASEFITYGFKVSELQKSTAKIFMEMERNHSVIIASSTVVKILKNWFCTTSFLTNEIRRLMIFSDSSEGEDIFGYAVSKLFPKEYETFFMARLRWLVESNIVLHYYSWASNMKSEAKFLNFVDRTHQVEQDRVCSEDFSPEMDINVKAICPEYFLSFFAFMLCLFFIAYAVNLFEIRLNSTHKALIERARVRRRQLMTKRKVVRRFSY